MIAALPNPPFPKDAKVMGYRTSRPVKSYTAIGSVILIFCLGSGLYEGGRNLLDMLGVTAILGGILILIHLQQFGYRVAYDDQGIYVRRWGIFNALNLKSEITSVSWEKILGFTTSLRQVFGRDWDYEPNEFLEINAGRKTKERIRIYPYMIDMRDFEEFANAFSTKLGKNVELE